MLEDDPLKPWLYAQNDFDWWVIMGSIGLTSIADWWKMKKWKMFIFKHTGVLHNVLVTWFE